MHPIYPPLLILAALSTLYAVLLSTTLGREWATSKTWTTVVLGVVLVLGTLALYAPGSALLALLFFAVGGLPMIVRALVLEFHSERRIAQRHMGDK